MVIMASNIDNWVERLKNAFDGLGTDEYEVLSVLTEAKGQMQELNSRYPELEDELYSELNEQELKKALPLYYEVPSPRRANPQGVDDPDWANRLYNAFHPSGLFNSTDEDALMLVLREAYNAGQMGALDKLFHERYPGEDILEESLYSELSGDELKSALRLYYKGLARETNNTEGTGPEGIPGSETGSSGTAQVYDKPRKIIVDGTIVPGSHKNPVVRSVSVGSRISSPAGAIKGIQEYPEASEEPQADDEDELQHISLILKNSEEVVSNVTYEVVGSDGKNYTGTTSGTGLLSIEDVPAGECSLRLAGYEYIIPTFPLDISNIEWQLNKEYFWIDAEENT